LISESAATFDLSANAAKLIFPEASKQQPNPSHTRPKRAIPPSLLVLVLLLLLPPLLLPLLVLVPLLL
jgi:hypothetical protein